MSVLSILKARISELFTTHYRCVVVYNFKLICNCIAWFSKEQGEIYSIE